MKDVVFLRSKDCILDLELYRNLMKAWERIHWEKKLC